MALICGYILLQKVIFCYGSWRRTSFPAVDRGAEPGSLARDHDAEPGSLAVDHGAEPGSLAMDHGAKPCSLAVDHSHEPGSLAVDHGAEPGSLARDHSAETGFPICGPQRAIGEHCQKLFSLTTAQHHMDCLNVLLSP
jgi:hypothetical protein